MWDRHRAISGCVEIQEELSDGWTTRRVNGQNGSGLAPAAASLNGFVGGARKAVGGCACGCPGVGQQEAGAPAFWGKGATCSENVGARAAFIYT